MDRLEPVSVQIFSSISYLVAVMTVVWSAEKQHRLWEEEEEVRKMKQLLEDLEKNVTLQPAEQRNPASASLMVNTSFWLTHPAVGMPQWGEFPTD